MIITLTTNIHGHQRLYLGGTSSLDVWIEKADDGRHWTLHTLDGLGGNMLSDADKRATVTHRLMALCREFDCPPEMLADIPFGVMASLHDGDVRHNRRMATPRKAVAEHAYVATAPNMYRPRGDFRQEHYEYFRRHR